MIDYGRLQPLINERHKAKFKMSFYKALFFFAFIADVVRPNPTDAIPLFALLVICFILWKTVRLSSYDNGLMHRYGIPYYSAFDFRWSIMSGIIAGAGVILAAVHLLYR